MSNPTLLSKFQIRILAEDFGNCAKIRIDKKEPDSAGFYARVAARYALALVGRDDEPFYQGEPKEA